MVLVRCFCSVVLCYDHCHFYLFQCQEGKEEGCGCTEGGKGSSAEEEVWDLLMASVLLWIYGLLGNSGFTRW